MLKKINKHYFPKNYLFAPEWIVLGVNNVCNLHCKMCDVGTKTIETNFAQNLIGTHPINMPLALIQKTIDQMAIFYPKAKLGYAFTEPLVYPHLEESLIYAKSKQVETSITTNALTLKQKAEKLIDGALGNLFISLDGPQDIHNEIRGHKKSFQKAVEGIETILNLNPELPISIFCVITEWNIGHLKALVDFFKDYPIQRIGFMHTNYTPQHIADQHNDIWLNTYTATASNVEEVNVDNFDLQLLLEEITAIKNENYKFPISFSPEITSKEKLHEFYHQPEKIIGRVCNDVFSNIMIKSDGSVIPAHGRCYNLTLGNLYEDSLKEIWNSKILKKFRSDLINNGGLLPACSRCCSAF
ncbi:radical SAM protein [Aquimarina sp. 2201CG14-23]|uniref:radical SAM protein n=1 Tax=Aquimarina mycalae TaxID=3040073 RepID=UPI002477DE06|nr:radical SAM protein [Aquimarina sp. 2201CG14-23]MDH7448045.1 radical SAM protein [Aquimarina sp. 2201CG14-23]